MMVSAENDPRRQGTIWVLHVDQEMPAVAPRLRAEFSCLTLDLAPALAASTNSLSLTEITKRIESGRQCHVARVDGQIAAYGWVSFVEEDIGELNLRIKLLAGEAYIWDCATLPAFREKLLYSALLSTSLASFAPKTYAALGSARILKMLPHKKELPALVFITSRT